MIHLGICLMVYACGPTDEPILQVPPYLPNRYSRPGVSEQHISNLYRLGRSRDHILPPNRLMIWPS